MSTWYNERMLPQRLTSAGRKEWQLATLKSHLQSLYISLKFALVVLRGNVTDLGNELAIGRHLYTGMGIVVRVQKSHGEIHA